MPPLHSDVLVFKPHAVWLFFAKIYMCVIFWGPKPATMSPLAGMIPTARKFLKVFFSLVVVFPYFGEALLHIVDALDFASRSRQLCVWWGTGKPCPHSSFQPFIAQTQNNSNQSSPIQLQSLFTGCCGCGVCVCVFCDSVFADEHWSANGQHCIFHESFLFCSFARLCLLRGPIFGQPAFTCNCKEGSLYGAFVKFHGQRAFHFGLFVKQWHSKNEIC